MASEMGKVRLPLEQLEETLSKLTVPELQQRLKKRGLKKSGVKAKLIQRLAEAIESEYDEEEDANASINRDESSGPLNDVSLESDTGITDSSAKESSTYHDPYTEFESSISGVGNVYENEKVNDGSVEIANEANSASPSEDLSQATEPTAYEEEQSGIEESHKALHENQDRDLEGNLPEDDDAIDGNAREKESMVHGLDQSSGVLEGIVDTENKENLLDYSESDTFIRSEKVESHFVANCEEADGEDVHEDQYETEEGFQAPKEEGHIEDEVSQKGGHEEVPAENVKGSTTADEQMETQVDSGNSGDLEAGLNENEEAVIEVNLEKSEKDEFASSEMDVEKQSETPVKQESKLSKKKLTTPVHLKKRKNVTEGDSDPKQDTPVPRKRRWGSSRSNESLTISSESLKGLIPDVSMIPTPNEDPLGLGLDYGEMEEGEIDDVPETDAVRETGVQLEGASELKEVGGVDANEEGNFQKEVRRGRIVRISMKDTVKLQRAESKEGEEEEEEEKEIEKENENDTEKEINVPEEKVSLLPEISSEDPEYVRERSPSPAKNEPSRILNVRNLVRPFTLRQLREFLSKAGTVVEEGFWIDRIKSRCYVTYETIDEAIASRSVIHGARWPAANPKLLSADFAVNGEMYKETEGKLGTPPSPVRNEEIKPEKDRSDERQRKRERTTEREKRERDKPRDKENKAAVSAKPKEKKEAPGKLLDDLFRKTKALPCIYWLPLTDEQITSREVERQKRRENRLKLNEEAQARENKEREDRKKEREIEIEARERERGNSRGRSDARTDRSFPVQYRNRRRPHSP